MPVPGLRRARPDPAGRGVRLRAPGRGNTEVKTLPGGPKRMAYSDRYPPSRQACRGAAVLLGLFSPSALVVIVDVLVADVQPVPARVGW